MTKLSTELNVYGLCRDFIEDNSTWLGENRTGWLQGLCRSRSLKQLSAISSHPRARVTSARDPKFYLQVEAFFKKNAAFTDKTQARDSAELTFERGERICRITNKRLDHYYAHDHRLDDRLKLLIGRSIRWIDTVLGDFGSFLEVLPSEIRLTSGATASSPRNASAPPLKIRRTLKCYPGTAPYLHALTAHYGLSKVCKVQVVPWNRVEFVPKNWKTDRTIACEQDGSLPFQLAFDAYAKRRLRRFGIDLSDQSPNQVDAYQGSIDGSFTTIDMSMASDTVAFNTVAWLLPQEWFCYLKAHRASHYQLQKCTQKYAKFSSMGNGATFALETLIFAAFARACGSRRGHVYGDDVTIEPEFVPDFLRLLRFFGFIPNEEKSCLRGPYRESCGVHYYNGELITPFYIRSTDAWDKPNAAHNVNGLAAVSEYGKVWEHLKRFCQKRNLLLVPASESTTTGVHVHPTIAHNLKLFRKSHPDKRGGWGLDAKVYSQVSASSDASDLQGAILWHLRASTRRLKPVPRGVPGNLWPLIWSMGLESSKRYTTLRKDGRKYRQRWAFWEIQKEGYRASLYGWSEFLTS